MMATRGARSEGRRRRMVRARRRRSTSRGFFEAVATARSAGVAGVHRDDRVRARCACSTKRRRAALRFRAAGRVADDGDRRLQGAHAHRRSRRARTRGGCARFASRRSAIVAEYGMTELTSQRRRRHAEVRSHMAACSRSRPRRENTPRRRRRGARARRPREPLVVCHGADGGSGRTVRTEDRAARTRARSGAAWLLSRCRDARRSLKRRAR